MTSQLVEEPKTKAVFPYENRQLSFAPYGDGRVSVIVTWITGDNGELEENAYSLDARSNAKLPKIHQVDFVQRVRDLIQSGLLREFVDIISESKRVLRIDLENDGGSCIFSRDNNESKPGGHQLLRERVYYHTDGSTVSWPSPVTLRSLLTAAADPSAKKLDDISKSGVANFALVKENLVAFGLTENQTRVWHFSKIYQAAVAGAAD